MDSNQVDAQKLRQRWERLELDRLELSDRAMREGWFMTPRHVEEYRGLDAAFKADLGEDGYDAYLYATGQDNRVLVRDVLAGSAASAADIQPGDEIVSYNGTKIYTKTELLPQTAAGARGDLVTIDLIRRGEALSLRVQRGPLGVVLGSAKKAPRQP
jgi:C-terminal processing protease CtpA/Prc